MNDNILERLIAICQDTFPNEKEKISATTFSQDINAWDSMGHIILIGAIEQAFDIQFDIEDLLEFDGLERISSSIEKLLQKDH